MDVSAKKSKRVKLFAVSEEAIVGMFRIAQGESPNELEVPVLDLPEGYTVTDIFYEPARQAWLIRVEHKSFDIVELHTEQPIIAAKVTYKAIRDYTKQENV